MRHESSLIGTTIALVVGVFGTAHAQETRMNQNGPVINQNVTSHNQTGGITAHTVIVGTQKLRFESAIASELVAKLPSGKPIRLVSIGSASDQAVADQYMTFLKDRGFQVPN